MGYNPNDLIKGQVKTDNYGQNTLWNLKNKIAREYSRKINLSLIRCKTGKRSFIGKGIWIRENEDLKTYKRIVYPFILSLIESKIISNIKPSGNNQ